MKQSQFYYLLRRGLFKGASIVKEGLVMFNKFTTAGISHPAQGSAEFDGASDYISIPSDITTSAISIGAWCYYDGSKSTNTLLNTSPHNSIAISLNRLGGNETYVYLGNGSSWLGAPSINVTATSANKWFYLTLVSDGTDTDLYIDGSLEGSRAHAPSGWSNTTNWNIGRLTTPATEHLSGNLANVAIWNRALSSDEINSVMWKSYDALEASEKSGLKAWYSLDDVASPSASLATMEALAVDKDATIENTAAITAAINALS